MENYIPLFGVLIAAFSAILGAIAARRTQARDDKEEATKETTLIVKLDSINTGVIEIKTEIRSVKVELQEIRDRTIRNEESTKSAHAKIKAIEERLNARDALEMR